MGEGISQAEFARRMGVSRQAVSKRVCAGRLSTLEDGTLDPDRVEAEWRATEAPAVSMNPIPARAHSPRPTQPPASAAQTLAALPVAYDDLASYTQARAAKEVAAAKLKQIEVEQKLGTLVSIDEIASAWFDAARTIRSRLMAIPARLAAELAPELSVHDARQRLDEEIRGALISLAHELRPPQPQSAAPQAQHPEPKEAVQ